MKSLKRGLTLFELIVIVIILLLLSIIGYVLFKVVLVKTRDATRSSHISNLYNEIVLAEIKWNSMNDYFVHKKDNAIIFSSKDYKSVQGYANLDKLDKKCKNYVDPNSWLNYPIAISNISLDDGSKYFFLEIATINEFKKEAKLKSNYFPASSWDSDSIITDQFWKTIVDWWKDLPY